MEARAMERGISQWKVCQSASQQAACRQRDGEWRAAAGPSGRRPQSGECSPRRLPGQPGHRASPGHRDSKAQWWGARGHMQVSKLKPELRKQQQTLRAEK